jgi:hypothetical protein
MNARAELLAELGITAELQRCFDSIAGQLRAARTELEEAYEVCEPGSDTKARCREALAALDSVLYQMEWRAPDPDGRAPS